MNDPRPTMVILRAAKERPLPVSVYGYQCRCCGEALVASPTGEEALKRPGAFAVCGKCGLELSDKLAARDMVAAVAVSARAQGQMEKLGIDIGPTERRTLEEIHEEIEKREREEGR